MITVAIIPARGGSKGVPRKNLREVAGKPLIAWSIEAALAVRRLSSVVVSTDDEEIASIARSFGAEVPFLRPQELASDTATSLSVLQHAVPEIEGQTGNRIDRVLLLQPTSPLRVSDDLEASLDIMEKGNLTSVVSVVPVEHAHPMLLKTIKEGILHPYLPDFPEGARRQDLTPSVYTTNGAVYVLDRDTIVSGGSLLGHRTAPYVMDMERSLDIDTEFDLKLADFLLRQRERAS